MAQHRTFLKFAVHAKFKSETSDRPPAEVDPTAVHHFQPEAAKHRNTYKSQKNLNNPP